MNCPLAERGGGSDICHYGLFADYLGVALGRGGALFVFACLILLMLRHYVGITKKNSLCVFMEFLHSMYVDTVFSLVTAPLASNSIAFLLPWRGCTSSFSVSFLRAVSCTIFQVFLLLVQTMSICLEMDPGGILDDDLGTS